MTHEPEHEHRWAIESGIVIDTYPETRTWYCECGAATHNPTTGEVCGIGHFDAPEARREPDGLQG